MSDETQYEPDPDEGPLFVNVNDFVNNFLVEVYRRPVVDVSDRVWCPEWWQHPEAWARLTALWHAWEAARKGAADEMSNWWLQHADRQMDVLLSPKGPFMYCSVRDGHKDLMGPLPSAEPESAEQAEAMRFEMDAPPANGQRATG